MLPTETTVIRHRSPPRTARRRIPETQTQTPCDFAASVDSLPSMGYLFDTITAATIATIHRLLATLGFLPHTANASGVETPACVALVAPSVVPSVTSAADTLHTHG